jgi:hypothetical protein
MQKPILISCVRFEYLSEQKEITSRQLKGAFNAYVKTHLKEELDINNIPLNLGYNRDDLGKPMQRYPLLQFYRNDRIVEVIGIDKGDTIVNLWLKRILKANDFTVNGKPTNLLYPEITTQQWYPQLSPHQRTYKLKGWKPFDSETLGNEKRLDGIIWGNIHRMLSDLGVKFDEKVVILLQNYKKQKSEKGYQINWLTYDAIFSTNINLPQHIGIGHEPSLGSGKIRIIDQ